MSFVANDIGSEQLSLFDFFNTLTDREKRFLDKSWAKYFAENIFPKIDEKPYAFFIVRKTRGQTRRSIFRSELCSSKSSPIFPMMSL